MTEKENNRLVTIVTPLYQDASTITLEEFIRKAYLDIESRCITIYNLCRKDNADNVNYQSAESERLFKKYVPIMDESMYHKAFSETFKFAGKWLNETSILPIYTFRVNPKNINFETTLSNTMEWFNGMSEIENFITREHNECSCGCTEPSTKIVILKDIPNWRELFGAGEFPFMSIYVFRLGNTEYFSYGIHS